MKKRICSLILLFSMLISFVPVSAADEHCFGLGDNGFFPTEEITEGVFVPEEDGIYRFDYEYSSYYPLYDVFLLDVETGESLSITGDGTYAIAALKSGIGCNIEIYNQSSTFPDSTDTPLNVKISAMEAEDIVLSSNMKVNEDSVYAFVPNNTGTLLMVSEDTFFNFTVIDLENQIRKTACWINDTNQISMEVEAGTTYYIFAETSSYIKASFQNTADNSDVITSDYNDLKSNHYYENNMDKKYIYTGASDTKYMDITFSTQTKLDSSDCIYIYGNDESEKKSYTGSQLSGKTISLKGNKLVINLVTDDDMVNYGFEVTGITEYTDIQAPTANKASGTVKPFTLSLSAHNLAEIYYSFSENGAYEKYSSAFAVKESCTIYAYAKIGDFVSDTVKYEYNVDNSPLKAPEFKVESQSSSCITLSISAEEGEIYYKKILNSSSYSKYIRNISVYENDVIAAYAKSGDLKSETVYYQCNFENSEENELNVKPIITIEPYIGGKKVTVSLPNNTELYEKETYNNYCGSHDNSMCGSDEYIHDMGPWSIVREAYYVGLTVGDADNNVTITSSDTADFPKEYNVEKNTVINTQIHYDYNSDTGTWAEIYIGEDMAPGGMSMHESMYQGIEYYSNAQSGPNVFEYIEIPKTDKPKITAENNIAVLQAVENAEIYYSLNDSAYVKYENPFDVASGDNIKAYAVGMGSSKSDTAEFAYIAVTADAPIFTCDSIMGGKKLTISSSDNDKIYFSTDGDTFEEYTDSLVFDDYAEVYAYAAADGKINSEIVMYTIEMTQTAQPIPNYASGEVFLGEKITLESATDGAVIYYTTNGDDPTVQSNVYADGIEINGETQIKAVAYSMGCAKSDIITLIYTLRTAKIPEIKEEGISGGKKIYLSSKTENAVIYYTIDGTDPKLSETAELYKAPFKVSQNGVRIRAYAKCDKYIDSDEFLWTVELGKLTAVSFGIEEEYAYIGDELTMEAQDFVTIYYTTDGSEPTEKSLVYTSAITIEDDMTVKAVAVADGWESSIVTEKSYKVYVTETPYVVKKKNGNCMNLELKSETPDAVIYYTIDGALPTVESTVFENAFDVDKDTTVRAFAISDKRKNSKIMTNTILVRHAKTPTANVMSGFVEINSEIVLETEEGASIYYTTDGSEPTEQSILYNAPIKIDRNTTIKAYAVKDDYLDSEVVTYDYKLLKASNPDIMFGEDIMGGKTVELSSDTADAKIYYTIDGSEPNETSTLYESAVSIYDDTTVKAIAIKKGYLNSNVMQKEMLVPTADIYETDEKTRFEVLKNQPIETLLSSNGIVYYTTNGTEPTLQSDIYTPGAMSFENDTVVKAFAVGMGLKKSKTVTLYYDIKKAKVEMYTNGKDEDGDGNNDIITVTLTSVPGASIYYAVDNDEKVLYQAPIEISKNCLLHVTASAEGYNSWSGTFTVYTNIAPKPKVSGGITFSKSNVNLVKGDTAELLVNNENVNIYYRFDNESEWKVYSAPIKLDVEDILYAYSGAENYMDSNTITVRKLDSSTIYPFIKEQTEDTYGGKFYKPDVYISADSSHYSYTTPENASISYSVHYTTDGSEPTANSPECTNEGIFLNKSGIIKTVLITEYGNSEIYEKAIEISKQSNVSFTPAGNEVLKNTMIILSCGDTDVNIYYTDDGSEPTTDKDGSRIVNGKLYTEPFTLSKDTQIKALAFAKGKSVSDVSSVKYSVKRVETPEFTEKMTAGGKLITISCATENAIIRYTLDGTEIDENSMIYTQPFKLKKNSVLTIKAEQKFMADSYTVSELIEVPYSEMSVIEIGNAEYNEDGFLSVPVSVKKNPGIAAYSLKIGYDSNILTPISAQKNWDGMFVTNLQDKTNSTLSNRVSVTWIGNNSVYDDGEMFRLLFKVNNIDSETDTQLTLNENGVINHLYETVDVAYMDGTATVKPQKSVRTMNYSEENAASDVTLKTQVKKSNAETLEVSVYVDDNSGIGAYKISLQYNTELFTPISAENGELFESNLMSNITQPDADIEHIKNVSVLSCNDKNISQNGELFKLKFKINSPVYVEQNISFSDAQLYTIGGNNVSLITENADIEAESSNYIVEFAEASTVQDVKAYVYNNTTATTSAKLIVAAFDSKTKALTAVKSTDVTLTPGKNPINDIGAIDATENDTLGIYLWSSFETMLPLAKANKTK